MKKPLLAISVVLSACVSASYAQMPQPQAAKSPDYSGIRTVADARLQADVTQSVSNYEVAAGGVAKVTLVAAKSLGREGKSYVEQWRFESASKTVEYRVTFTVSAGGGVDFGVAKLE